MNLRYCSNCQKKTNHTENVNSFASICNICGDILIGIDQAKTESNTFTAPDGTQGKLVHNDSGKAVFEVSEGDRAGLYVYDKNTGFGGIQYRPGK
jgi:hypothetical protein